MNKQGLDTNRTEDGADVSVDLHVHDKGSWHFDWKCEKWSEDAVEFCQRKLEDRGVEQIRDGNENVGGIVVPRFISIHHGITSDVLREIVGAPEEVIDVPDNLLLNEGIGRLLDLLTAAGGTAYNNANAFIGVGDSATAEAASQTELQAATNRFYKAMVATYPVSPGTNGAQSRDWRSDFTSSEANYAWQEWSISAGATTASGAGFTTGTTNLNRKVQSLGTKTTGTWTLTATVTIS
jgi:hypothetical protein